jgi:peroxiredoxin
MAGAFVFAFVLRMGRKPAKLASKLLFMSAKLAVLAFAAATALAQQKPASTGPAIGAAVPAVEAPDQTGKSRTLPSILGPKGAILVFYRSADWWPFCKAQLVELEQNYAAIRKQGLGLAAISHDSIDIIKSFAARKQITFPLLSDPDAKIIRAYGILNDTVEKTNPFYGIPYPGTYVVDAKGVVVAKYFEDDFQERETAAAILVKQFGLPASAAHSTKETKQLSLATSASTETIATGEHVALEVDIDLKPKMHVYAPGVQGGYIAIDWQSADSDAAKAQPARYPEAKMLRLEAIKETVPVYTGHFRMVRDIVFGPDAKLKPMANEKGEVTVSGTLLYQACDDQMCYLPTKVPLTWTFHYQPLDRQRAPAEIQRKPPK